MRTALEQELGLAAYFVSNDVPLEKGAKNEVLESDGEKLSSTDEDEEAGVEGEGAGCTSVFFPLTLLGHPLNANHSDSDFLSISVILVWGDGNSCRFF